MPERVVALVGEAIAQSSQVAVANASGLSRLTIQRCSRGIGEPSQATLEKLAAYFGARVQYLRGSAVEPLDRFLGGVRKEGYTRETFNEKMVEQRANADENGMEDYWEFFVNVNEALPEWIIMHLCRVFGINWHWVEYGTKPTDGSGGFVGEESLARLRPVIRGVAIIPGETSGTENMVVQAVRCARCGGVLKRADHRPSEQYASYWPCETCCKN